MALPSDRLTLCFRWRDQYKLPNNEGRVEEGVSFVPLKMHPEQGDLPPSVYCRFDKLPAYPWFRSRCAIGSGLVKDLDPKTEFSSHYQRSRVPAFDWQFG